MATPTATLEEVACSKVRTTRHEVKRSSLSAYLVYSHISFQYHCTCTRLPAVSVVRVELQRVFRSRRCRALRFVEQLESTGGRFLGQVAPISAIVPAVCVRVAGNRWPVYTDASVCVQKQRIPLERNVSYRRGKGGYIMVMFTTMGD